jgi:DNA-directed RNA polymerase subunit M/transcription elongation factor TFIIS
MLRDNHGTVDVPKTPVGQSSINFPLPTINRPPPLESLESILGKVQIGHRGSLSPSQITLLQSLKWKSDRGSVLTLENRPLIYEIIGMCEQVGIKATCEYIQELIDNGESRWTEIIFQFQTFNINRNQYQADIIRIRDKIQVNDNILECPACHSMKTSYTQSQTRSADEPMTIIAVCSKCGHHWRS